MTAVASVIEELFIHNNWANLRLLEICEKLSDEKLDASAPGTYGSVRDTLMHIVGAQERYVARLTRRSPQGTPGEEFSSVADLKERARASGEALQAISSQTRGEETLEAAFGGKDYLIDAVVVLVQAINHATDHRTHISTILSQNGVEPPQLDGWTFGSETGKLRER